MGIAGAISMCILLFGVALLAAIAWINFPGATDMTLPVVLRTLWIAWVAIGALVGQDLFWHPAIERYRVLGLSVRKTYAMNLALGFLSPGVLALACVFAARAFAVWHASFLSFFGLSAAFALTAQTAKVAVSIARALLIRAGDLNATLRLVGSGSLAVIVSVACFPFFSYHSLTYSAVDVLAARMSGRAISVLPAVCVLALVTLVDYHLYKSTVQASLQGNSAIRLVSPAVVAPLRRVFTTDGVGALAHIALIGWLRNRSAMLLAIWGLGYGFGYVFKTKPEEPVAIIAYIWMVSLFHSYLRGNLFGVDRRAVWWYAIVPQGLVGGVNAKNRALSFVQYTMFAGVMIACIGGGRPVFRVASTWIALIAATISLTTCGTIVGSYTSIVWPEPIERASQYSGGTALGAILVPVSLTIAATLLAVSMSMAASRWSPQFSATLLGGVAVATMGCKVLFDRRILPVVIARQREVMRKQLSAFKT